MHSNNISRRQLFGGARRQSSSALGQGGKPIQPGETLTPSPGLKLDDLPPVHQATWTAAQVRDLFRDLANEASDVRFSSGSHGEPIRPGELSQAGELLLSGGIKRLQIRYSWQGKMWIDTLDSTGEGFRVVRIAHPAGVPGRQDQGQ